MASLTPSAPDDEREAAGLTSTEAAALLEKYGRNEVEDKTKPKWRLFCEQVRVPKGR
jgi:hypothetical protein